MDYLWQQFQSFVDVSRRMSVLERIIYWISLPVCMVLAVFFVISAWRSYMLNPTVVSVYGDKGRACSQVAATVCPHTAPCENCIRMYVEKTWPCKRTVRRYYYIEFIKRITSYSHSNKNSLARYIFDPTLPTKNFTELAIQVAFANYSEIHSAVEPMWFDNMFQDPKLLLPTMTERGLCFCIHCIYNISLSHAEMLMNFTERATTSCSSLMGGTLLGIKTETSVFLHSPKDVPDFSKPNQWSANQDSRIYQALTIYEKYASPRLDHLSLRQKKCISQTENFLTVAPWYSKSMCQMECRKKLLLKECGCVPHFYWKSDMEKGCDITGLICVISLRKTVLTMMKNDSVNCTCTQACDYLTSIPLTSYEIYRANLPGYVYTRDGTDRTFLYHDIVYTEFDMLASWGGAITFFLGTSIIACLEIAFLVLCWPFRKLYRHFAVGINLCCCRKVKQWFRDSRILQAILVTAHEWLSFTTVHGVKILVNESVTVFERIFWCLVLLTFFSTSYWVTKELLQGQGHVMYEMKVSQVSIPFRTTAFTFCLQAIYFNQTEIRLHGLKYSRGHGCCLWEIMYPSREFGYTYGGRFKKCYCDSYDLPETMKVAKVYEDVVNCKNFLYACSYDGHRINCCDEFKVLLTERGYCYSLNTLQNPKFANSVDLKTELYYNIGKKHLKLEVSAMGFMNPDRRIVISTHSVTDVPTINMDTSSHIGRHFRMNYVYLLARETIPDSDLIELEIKDRQCRMPWETLPNSYYPHYSYTGCIAECRAKMMLEVCGCVHLLSPIRGFHRRCTLKELACLQLHKHILLSPPKKESCSCLQDCYDIQLKPVLRAEAKAFLDNFSFSNIKVLASNEYIVIRRLRGRLETIVIAAGVFSLFLGVSFSNLMEILMFSTFRLVHNYNNLNQM